MYSIVSYRIENIQKHFKRCGYSALCLSTSCSLQARSPHSGPTICFLNFLGFVFWSILQSTCNSVARSRLQIGFSFPRKFRSCGFLYGGIDFLPSFFQRCLQSVDVVSHLGNLNNCVLDGNWCVERLRKLSTAIRNIPGRRSSGLLRSGPKPLSTPSVGVEVMSFVESYRERRCRGLLDLYVVPNCATVGIPDLFIISTRVLLCSSDFAIPLSFFWSGEYFLLR